MYGVEGGIWVAGCSAPLVFHSSVGGGGHSSARCGGEGRFFSFQLCHDPVHNFPELGLRKAPSEISEQFDRYNK